MSIKTPKLDTRSSNAIYKQAIEYAKIYCPQWTENWTENDYFDSENLGLVILKLFSNMTESLILQLNKIPDKHRLAFLDFMGIDLLPARPARVPLTFYLSEGAKEANVPSGTLINSAEDPDIVFETAQSLSVVSVGLSAVYSLNPWGDKYSDHTNDFSTTDNSFELFAGDTSIDHILYLGDDLLFDIRRQAEITIYFKGYNLSPTTYFKNWFPVSSNPLPTNKLTNSVDYKMTINHLEKTTISGTESFWISVKPDYTYINSNLNNLSLPEISKISADVEVNNITPEFSFFNDMPIDTKKGFYPFGETPKVRDTFYIGSEEAFSKVGSTITLTFDLKKGAGENPTLSWEYWNGKKWITLIPTNIDSTVFLDSIQGLISNDLDLEFIKGYCYSVINNKYYLNEGLTQKTKERISSILDSMDYSLNDFLSLSGNTIYFVCPSTQPIEINGQLNRWIRVRIKSGDYGKEGRIVDSDKLRSTLEGSSEITNTNIIITVLENAEIIHSLYKPPSFDPPYINSMSIKYKYTNSSISKCIPYNNFVFNNDIDLSEIDDENPFKPFETLKDQNPALYLGFKESLANRPITLFFDIKEKLYDEKNQEIYKSTDATDYIIGFNAKYFNGTYESKEKKWLDFAVEDTTNFFNSSEILTILPPHDIQKHKEFGKDLYWIKLKVRDGNRLFCPKLKGIFPNTVWTKNYLTVNNEILGSGNGKPNLTLPFSKKPILEGQIIEIKESEIPSDEELKMLKKEEGNDALTIVKDESGEVKEIWIRWHEIKDFALSEPSSRHYIMDRVNGLIFFGDGVRGLIPSRGMNNIVAKLYRSGGGLKGNLKAETITKLKTTIPHIDHVINHTRSAGGMNQENIDRTVNRGPYTIKNRDRAVTIEDFEKLALEVSQEIAKSKCLLQSNRDISVIIVPKKDEDTPLPESALLDSVKRYLKERALFTIQEKINVVGPEYKKVDVTVNFVSISISESSHVSDKIKERLKTFLHPLKGGQNGEGWDFGQAIFISELAAIIKNIEGVKCITYIKIKFNSETEWASEINKLELNEKNLPCSGTIRVNLDDESEITYGPVFNPVNPKLAGSSFIISTDQPPNFYVSGSYAYIVTKESHLRIINISDPFNPSLLDNLDNIIGISGAGNDIHISENYIYIATDQGLDILDIGTHPDSPVLIQNVRFGTGTGINDHIFASVYVSGEYVYVLTNNNILRIIHHEKYPENYSFLPIDYNLLQGNYLKYFYSVYVSGHFAYITTYNQGLHIVNIDIENPTNTSKARSWNNEPMCLNVHVSGEYAFAGTLKSGLKVLKISDIGVPELVYTIDDITGIIFGVFVSNNYLYVTVSESGFKIYDIANPESPIPVGSYDISDECGYGMVSGDYAYVLTRELLPSRKVSLQVIDIFG